MPVLVETPAHEGAVMPIEYRSPGDRARVAVNDLAERLAVAPGEIRVVGARPVEWPSSAVGCPQPGQMYMTAITPGYEIVLETQGMTYHYHSGEAGKPFLCPEDRREPPASFRD
jgi:hypothetical protein